MLNLCTCMCVYIYKATAINAFYFEKGIQFLEYGSRIKISWSLIISSYIFYLIIEPVIVGTFIFKLHKLNNNEMDKTDLTISNENNVLTMITKKYIIVYSFQFITTFIRLLTQFTQSVLTTNINTEIWLIASASTYYLDLIVNIGAIYLQYNFGKNDYYFCCYACDKSCLTCIQNKRNLELIEIETNRDKNGPN